MTRPLDDRSQARLRSFPQPVRRPAAEKHVLATFVIGLREGLEAALIVGIVAAFLRRRAGRTRCGWSGSGSPSPSPSASPSPSRLQLLSASLPQVQQEMLETVIGGIAVAIVTYMIVWMRRNARGLKRHLEGAAGMALASGTAWALVGMAFLAVLREGFETAVFLLAAFQAVDLGVGRRARGAARDRRRGGDRLWHLSRRHPHRPGPVLPAHRSRPRPRCVRSRCLRPPHGPRGGLGRRRTGHGYSTSRG